MSRCSLHVRFACLYEGCNFQIEGSLAFCALMLFLCSGSSFHVECILPFGTVCLSAWRMMFVKMVFAVCMSGSGRM